MLKIICPLYIEIPRKTKANKKYYLNLNNYRNWNFIVSNNIKKAFKEKIKTQINEVKEQLYWLSINLIYQLYYWDNRVRDKGNVLSVIQKFFLDALVEYWALQDDNDEYIWDELFKKPLYDKWKGRVEIIIQEIL